MNVTNYLTVEYATRPFTDSHFIRRGNEKTKNTESVDMVFDMPYIYHIIPSCRNYKTALLIIL
jgi:hypothetical protein